MTASKKKNRDNSKLESLLVRIDPEILKKFRLKSVETGIPMAQLIERMIRNYLAWFE